MNISGFLRSSSLRRAKVSLCRAFALLAALALLAVNFQRATAMTGATIIVNSAADGPLTIDGNCTLREAILAANANTGVDCVAGTTGLDTITFDPAVFNVDTIISATGNMPDITAPVVIRGPGSHWVKVRGVGGSSIGFTFTAGSTGSVLDRLIVNGWNVGVESDGGGVSLTNSRFGVDFNGTAAEANTIGVELNSSHNIVGGLDSGGNPRRNVISGNTSYGIVVSGGSNNLIQGNYIGTDASGNTALANGFAGISVVAPAAKTIIGGTLPHQGNVIAGNTEDVILYSGAASTQIMRNFIGLGADGTTSLPGTYGIHDRGGSGTLIGGTMPQAGNFIAHLTYGIYLRNDASPGTVTISGNVIGRDATGAAAGNTQGIYFVLTPPKTAIKGNLIASNDKGIAYAFAPETLSQNCITGNTTDGAYNNTSLTEDARGNWWGVSTGPNTPGGDSTTGLFNLAPWLTKPPLSCLGYDPKSVSPKDQAFWNKKATPITLSWTKVATASSYDVGILWNGAPMPGASGLTVPSFSAGILNYGVYQWDVVTHTTDPVAWPGGHHTFYVTIQKSPKPGAVVKPNGAGQTTFTWNAYPGAASYSWALYATPDCLGIGLSATGLTKTSFTHSAASGIHSWTIQPNNGSVMPCQPFSVP